MKKFSWNVFFIILMTFTSLSAQSDPDDGAFKNTGSAPGDYQDALNKGSWMLDGSVNFNGNWGDEIYNETVEKIKVSPSALYFIRDRLGVGLTMSYSRMDVDGRNATGISGGPQFIYFIGDRAEKTRPFIAGTIQYLYVKLESDDFYNYESNQKGYAFSAVLGLMQFVTESVALRAGLEGSLQQITTTNKYWIQMGHDEPRQYFENDHEDTGYILGFTCGISYFIF
jgi:hypothetical protein